MSSQNDAGPDDSAPARPQRPTRTIWGNVYADGTKASGSGFRVSKHGTGSYVVRFNTAFHNVPAFSVSPANPTIRLFLKLTGLNSSELTFTLVDTEDQPENSAFSFILIGV